MKERYFNYLVEQFKQATGAHNIDVNSEMFLSEFYDWVKCRKLMINGYLDLLDNMGLDISGMETAEVGKGVCDSVVIDSYFDTRIITPFSSDLFEIDQNRLIISEFKVLGGTPSFVETDSQNNTIIRSVYSEGISNYITQNPYTLANIANWEKLHNSGQYSLIVAMYGNVFDNDRFKKIRQLKEFSEKLDDSFISEYNTAGDLYYYVIASYKQTKKLTKKLSK